MRKLISPVVKIAGQVTNLLYSDAYDVVQHLRALVIVGFASGLVLFLIVFSSVDVSKVYELQNYKPPLPSKLFDRKGRLISTYFDTHRIMVTPDQVDKKLVQAFIATEDNHFYDHWGIDLQAILRAFLINLQAGSVKQGGSTITQQLAKVILTDRARTYVRKAKEAILAIYIDASLTKEAILNMYFNQIYFGHGNYGVEAAAQFYFQKSAKDLRPGECAILASLPSAPNGNSPFKRPRRSTDKMSHVLMKMVDMGFLTRAEAVKEFRYMQENFYSGLNVSPSSTAFGTRTDHAPYFTWMLEQRLKKDLGRKLLYRGGLKIYSSLDIDHQRAAQDALWPALKRQNTVSRQYIPQRHLDIARHYKDSLKLIQMAFDLPSFEQERGFSQYEIQIHFHRRLAEKAELLNLGLGGEIKLDRFLNSKQIRDNNPFLNRYQSVQGAIAEVDNKTGEVTAMVGGGPFGLNQLNHAFTRRQPGSAFKPLIYAAAMENKKITAATIFPDSPIVFLDSSGDTWMPENYSGGYRGFISVREALAYSTNLVSIAVAREAGLSVILPTVAKQLQIKPEAIPYNLSVALGTFEVSPMQMAKAFSVFPRGGKTMNHIYIHRIEDAEGNVIRDYDRNRQETEEQVLSTSTATVMTSLLKGVVSSGTGGRARYGGYAAGKTGTTQNFRDAWFVGFNQRYTAAVWVGYDRATLSLGPGQAGGSVAAPIWGSFQAKVAKHRAGEKTHLHLGETVTVSVCKLTGKKPGSQCKQIVQEVFAPDNTPQETCEENHGVSMSVGSSILDTKPGGGNIHISKDDL